METPVPDPKTVVRDGYDAVSRLYRGDEEPAELAATYHAWMDALEPRLVPGERVLDLGCGCGVPVARRLASRYEFMGVDFSPVQIERARALAPEARFLVADMTRLWIPDHRFGAVLCLYALIHVPLEQQRSVLRNMHDALRDGGHLLATVGRKAWTGLEEDWLGSGHPMWWSHADEATYLAWMEEIGLEVEETRLVPEGHGGHTLVLARRP